MAKQTVNQGTAPTGAGGDTFRSGSAKLQANDDEIYAQLGGTGTGNGTLPAALPITKGGTGATTAAVARTNLGLGTAALLNAGTASGNVMQVGAFGLGVLIPPTFPDSFANQKIAGSGLYYTPTSAGLTDGQMLYISRGYWLKGIHFPVGLSAPNLISGTSSDSAFTASPFLVKNLNTTVDANGFIKSASPIVKLYANQIELNNEANQQLITFEKVDEGNYLIKASSGFAQEGWYIETPKDANGNVLFSVIYETLENGDISVKTYKKKFDLETASIVADLDNPVDIPNGRWIDLRLQELPQEVIHDTEQ